VSEAGGQTSAPPPLLVLLVVGLTETLLAHAPRLRQLADRGRLVHLRPPLPAVTCTSQASLLTGLPPSGHGIVGNGWYFRDLSEVWFWRQSNRLVRGERLWQTARRQRPGFTTAKLFWWFNMYADVELSVTPRPHYLADGRKIPGIYAEPPSLGQELEAAFGPFPLFGFWGPGADLSSSLWIRDAARWVLEQHRPDLTLVYLPHLDYALQREGPGSAQIPAAVAAIDRAAGELVDAAQAQGVRVAVVSEYGIEAVSRALFPNRALREAGLLRVRASRFTGELLDAGASRAFAVCDHQIAHVYVRDPADVPRAREVLARLEGVERVLGPAEKEAAGLDHPRAGELVVIASAGCWCSYYYWEDDALAPDFARTVDIHRKPGYDPVELFLAPGPLTKLRIGLRLAQKALGQRVLFDVIPLDPSLVGGSHGRRPSSDEEGPLLIVPDPDVVAPGEDTIDMTAAHDVLLRLLV